MHYYYVQVKSCLVFCVCPLCLPHPFCCWSIFTPISCFCASYACRWCLSIFNWDAPWKLTTLHIFFFHICLSIFCILVLLYVFSLWYVFLFWFFVWFWFLLVFYMCFVYICVMFHFCRTIYFDANLWFKIKKNEIPMNVYANFSIACTFIDIF